MKETHPYSVLVTGETGGKIVEKRCKGWRKKKKSEGRRKKGEKVKEGKRGKKEV